MKTLTSALALAILVPLAFTFAFTAGTSPSAASAPQQVAVNAATVSADALSVKKYSFATVKKHHTRSSCWTVISHNVYNLTAWINKHPGGAKRILSICGKDGTKAFRAQHGTSGSPNRILKRYKIGVLA